MASLINLTKHQRTIGAAHAGGVGEDGVDGRVYRFTDDIEVFRFIDYVFQIDVRRHEVILHHQYRIHCFACASHPVLVPGHGFGGGDEGTIFDF